MLDYQKLKAKGIDMVKHAEHRVDKERAAIEFVSRYEFKTFTFPFCLTYWFVQGA